ncbi:VanW family protein [Nocardioides nitrophenolicus]|uniref:VanW family protein n=1 Tax=Nocardioides nitrophenolicus TaxID=60489 RepID=UPI00195BCD08|nr:VanW family protein [Nocardioides nitrophenolicus]MBM7516134.1 vancomycin resistance protein YoaR [Nocardioides nitrophenolicus]
MTFWESDTGGETGGKAERPGGRIVVVVIVLLVLLAGGGYAAAHAVAGDKVPTGTTISGVEVGGLTRSAAIAKLEDTFGSRADSPITVRVGHQGASGKVNDAKVQPGEIGLAIDYAASVDAAGAGDSWSPARQWDYFTGGGKVDAVVDVDERLLDEKLTELSDGLGTPPQDGTVTFTSDGVQTTQPQAGQAVDRDQARTAITDAFLSGEKAVELEVAPAQPDIDAADVAEALDSFANPAMANPVTLQFGENDVKLTPAKFAPVLSMRPENGKLAPHVDEAALTELVKGATANGAPVDATVKINKKGKPKIVPAKPGVTFDSGEAAQVFLGLLTAPDGSRSGPVTAQVTDAAFTTKDAENLKIVDKVSEFSTYYPHADYRNINIGRAAELIDGTLLKPGEEFSLNGIVGERTAANGFTEGYIISNGILKKDLGGGVSQMATTTFNAMFFAGLKDIQHKPHSFYIDRYPVGREATVAWPTVDLRFQNDTEYGVLIHAWVVPSTWSRQGKVTVQMWSTKKWDIDSQTSGRYATVPPKVRTLTTPDCEPNTGWSGFQVDVTRIFRKHGDSAVDHTEKFHTVYTPADTVKCEKPAPPAGGSPDPGE